MQTSTALFEAEKQPGSITKVLDAACSVDASACSDYMARASARLAVECRGELEAGQPRVTQARVGLGAYGAVRAATCLRDGGGYCFVRAVSNLTDPSDSYLFLMPLGMPLPRGSTPSCDACTRRVMAAYHAAAAGSDPRLRVLYGDGAGRINGVCGAGFVNGTVPRAERSAAAAAAGGRGAGRRGGWTVLVAWAGLAAVGAAAFGIA
ncbi:hypothetical protein CDD80_5612 [Ophiocordyceps camponoti-rufipedis]|uniref:DUF7729 domain-containing protein n=1 Tax=Ophiocordyceps camponoti-rufipedis TaxID=2004952 RepID=A0A2C5YQF2_9HYPO|nr:hypothetical protein CDD80_5612 [Ophiocordyceps camponoti-rufipedis]